MSKIICVTNRKLCEGDFLKRLEQVAEANPCFVVLREKDLEEEDYEVLAKETLQRCESHQVCCVLHNFVEVAKRLNCKAIHLPMHRLRTLSVEDYKAFEAIGASCHCVEEAVEAEELGCSYIFAGHIFETDCKKGLEPRGLDFLKKVCESVSIPVYAIGGISPDNYKMAEKVGAAGVCVMSGLMCCEEPKEYMKLFGEVENEV